MDRRARFAAVVLALTPLVASFACGGGTPPPQAAPPAVALDIPPLASAQAAASVSRASAARAQDRPAANADDREAAANDDAGVLAKMLEELDLNAFDIQTITPVGDAGGGFLSGSTLGHDPGRPAPPSIRQGATTVNGRLPPEVIQRIVRQNFGRFRLCYENGLRANPKLEGRITVRFVIDPQGAVSSSKDAGSDLPDPAVVSCVARAFGMLSFPQPEGGSVVVAYPMNFSPGDALPRSAAPRPASKK